MTFLPVLTKDPLEFLRPFPEHPTLHWLAHWHEVILSLVFYSVIQLLSPWVSKRVVGKAYTDLDRKTRINFDIHVVSMVQCLISVGALIFSWNHDHITNRLVDPFLSVFGYNPYTGFVSAISVGYFLWDLVVCMQHYDIFGPGFLVHAVAAMTVFVCSFRPFCLPWVLSFLLFELSTPFVNVNWFASRLPAGYVSDRVVAINGILLLITFFVVRILWGFYAVGLLAYDMWQVREHVHPFYPIVVLGLNVSLDFLNLYWFSRMLRIAKKKFSKARPIAKEISKIE